MAHQAGRAALVAGTAAAVVKASEAQLAQFSVAMAGTAIPTVAAGGTVQAFFTFAAPLLNAVVALKAAVAVVAGKEQTVSAILAVGALIKGAIVALFTFRAVLSAFGAFAALNAVLTVVKLFFTALAVGADLAAVVAFIALFACLAPCLGTLGTGIFALNADIYLAIALTTDAMVSVKYGTVDAQAAGNAKAGAILTKITFATESDLITTFQTIRAMLSSYQCAIDAQLAIVAVWDALLAQAAILAHRNCISAFTAATAVIFGIDAAVDTHIVVILTDIIAVTACLPAFIADLIFILAVAAVAAVITLIKCTLVAHFAVIAPAVFLAVCAHPAVGTEVIVFPATLAAVIAVVAGIVRTLQAELAVFTPAGTFLASAALFAERYIIRAFAAFRAVRAAIHTAVRADIAAAFAQIVLVKAFLAVAAVMLLPAIVMVGVLAAVIAA